MPRLIEYTVIRHPDGGATYLQLLYLHHRLTGRLGKLRALNPEAAGKHKSNLRDGAVNIGDYDNVSSFLDEVTIEYKLSAIPVMMEKIRQKNPQKTDNIDRLHLVSDFLASKSKAPDKAEEIFKILGEEFSPMDGFY